MPKDSKVVITFPSSITLVDEASCTLDTVSGVTSSSAACSVSSNVVTLTNPFGTGSFAKGGSAFSFTFSSGGTNPDSVRDAGTFIVETFATIDSADYAIDYSEFDDVFTPTPALLDATVSLVSSYVAYESPVDYTLTITPNSKIPVGGYVLVEFPAEISLTGSVTTCTISIGTTPTCTGTTGSSPLITLEDAFTSAYTTTTTPFNIKIGGLRNPRTLAVTSTFEVYTYDSSDNMIAYKNSSITT
jgi:hypothetical protein